jgi:hypothetical protein
MAAGKTAGRKKPDPANEAPATGEVVDKQEMPPILELTTVNQVRSPLTIDGETYEIRRMGEFGVEDQHLIISEQAEFDKMWETDARELNAKERKRMGLILDRLTRKALDAPSDVIDRIDDEQRKAVVQVFISAPLQTLQRAVAQVAQELMEIQARNGSTTES